MSIHLTWPAFIFNFFLNYVDFKGLKTLRLVDGFIKLYHIVDKLVVKACLYTKRNWLFKYGSLSPGMSSTGLPKGSTISHVYRQIDPFASKLTMSWMNLNTASNNNLRIGCTTGSGAETIHACALGAEVTQRPRDGHCLVHWSTFFPLWLCPVQ